jgi:predicted phage terminase large subunit-like protein
VSVAAYPSQRLPLHTGRYQTFWVVDADIRRRHPHVITEDLLTMHRLRRFERVGVEAIQFQELFAEDLQARADLDPTLRDFHTVKLKPHSDKKLRIQKLGPLIHSRRLRFARKLTALYDQLRYFPHHAHDDGPDALELCLEVLGEIGWVMLDVAPPEAPTMTKPNSPAPSLREAANQQIKQEFAKHFERDDCGTCGECLHLDGARCSLRALLVEVKDPGCDAFDLREEQ